MSCKFIPIEHSRSCASFIMRGVQQELRMLHHERSSARAAYNQILHNGVVDAFVCFQNAPRDIPQPGAEINLILINGGQCRLYKFGNIQIVKAYKTEILRNPVAGLSDRPQDTDREIVRRGKPYIRKILPGRFA